MIENAAHFAMKLRMMAAMACVIVFLALIDVTVYCAFVKLAVLAFFKLFDEVIALVVIVAIDGE